MYAPLLRDAPLWFFHAANDAVIGVEESDRLVAALREAGNARVRYTRYARSDASASAAWMVGHNCWDAAFATAELYEWLAAILRERRAEEPPAPVTMTA